LDAKVASITTRQSITAPAVAKLMTNGYIPHEYVIDASPFINRPFYLGTVLWNENAARYSTLTLPVHQLPRDVFTSNLSLKQAMKMASLFRSELVINISLSGTLVHSGTLLVGILPPLLDPITSGNYIMNNESQLWINSILSGPHAFLHANEATSVTIDVPWYCNTDYGELDSEKDEAPNAFAPTGYVTNAALNFKTANYASLVVLVLQPLLKGGGSGDVSLVLEACFKNLELYLPAPRFLADSDWTVQSGSLINGKAMIQGGAAALGTSVAGPIGGAIGGAVGGLAAKATTGLLDLGTSSLKKAVPFLGDAFDFGRGLISSWTGLHNPNNPTISTRVVNTTRNFPNVTDTEQYFEKMDPYCTENRVVNQPIFSTGIDEMSLSHITSKRQYLGYFTVTTDTKVGDLLWCRPISPFQGGANLSSTSNRRLCANNIELLHSISRAWRGNMSIILQSSMNMKQFTKLKVIKYYNPSAKVLSATPSMQAMANAPSQLMEFNAGGQQLEIKLPFLCRNDLMPCSSDFYSEALMHGVYYIYLAQNLVIADESPKEINFNVYIKCEPDFRFYGYSVRPIEFVKNIPDQSELPPGKQHSELSKELVSWQPQSGNKVMNEPQPQDVDILEDHKQLLQNHCDRLRPTIDIRPYIRRMYLSVDRSIKMDGPFGQKTIFYPLSTFMGEFPFAPSWNDNVVRRTLQTVSNMYYGNSVGFKFHVQVLPNRFENTSVTDIRDGLNVNAFYVPPGINIIGKTLTLPTTYYSQFPNTDAFQGDWDKVPEVTYISQPTSNNNQSIDLEFSIPNITWYKFMGSMYKYLTPKQIIATKADKNTISTSDYGYLVLRFENKNLPIVEVPTFNLRIYTGLTDESRFGFHTIAPAFNIVKGKYDVYQASLNIPTNSDLPKSLYFGHQAI
jgi:hypothetical protein